MGKHQIGGGTNNHGGGSGQGENSSIIDLSSAKTQIEADKLIDNYIFSQGITRDNPEFDKQFQQIRTDAGVAELPIR